MELWAPKSFQVPFRFWDNLCIPGPSLSSLSSDKFFSIQTVARRVGIGFEVAGIAVGYVAVTGM